jgi:hypothetical protein
MQARKRLIRRRFGEGKGREKLDLKAGYFMGAEQEQSEIDGMEGSRSAGARIASCVEGSRVEGNWLRYAALECGRVSGL